MKSSKNIARQLFGLTLTLVGLLSGNTLPIHPSRQAVQAATRASVTEPTGQPVLRAVANGRVALVSSEGNAQSDIYTMNPDGSDRKQLTFSQEYEDKPVWSPDGTKIAFHKVTWTGNGGYSEIFVMNANGSDQRRLTQSEFDLSPTWSPEGTKIAFYRIDSITMPRSFGIYVMNADGSDQRAVASAFSGEPAWSPDGLKFAVGTWGGIYLINVDGSNPIQITQPPKSSDVFEDHAPAWSPDGSKITFARCVDSNGFGCYTTSHLWVVNADGSNPTKLTDTLAYTHAWSPDGMKIIFGSVDESLEPRDLFVMNPDGSGLTNITNTDGTSERSPSWQPLSLPPVVNPIDDPQFLVRQHYLDFLNREPDAGGLAYWTNEITRCHSNAACINAQRVGVSAAFFIEQEFQETGYYLYRFYKASFGRQPNHTEFTSDRSRITPDTNLEASKQAFADEWVQRPAFVAAYPITTSNTEFVNKLFDFAGLIGPRYDPLRQQEILAMQSGRSRALVLRDVIEIPDFKNIPDLDDPRYSELKQTSQYNPAFVLMQYFGYLRRDVDSGGYAFWLDILNNREPNNYRAMVCAFITSSEYQLRFGAVATRSNADCGQ